MTAVDWTKIRDAEQLAVVLSEKLDDDAPLNLRRWRVLAEELWSRIDADGLPVVTTVGDLTARHFGREIHAEGMRAATLLAMRQPLPDQPLVALLVRLNDDITSTDYLPLDTPCGVLS